MSNRWLLPAWYNFACGIGIESWSNLIDGKSGIGPATKHVSEMSTK